MTNREKYTFSSPSGDVYISIRYNGDLGILQQFSSPSGDVYISIPSPTILYFIGTVGWGTAEILFFIHLACFLLPNS